MISWSTKQKKVHEKVHDAHPTQVTNTCSKLTVTTRLMCFLMYSELTINLL